MGVQVDEGGVEAYAVADAELQVAAALVGVVCHDCLRGTHLLLDEGMNVAEVLKVVGGGCRRGRGEGDVSRCGRVETIVGKERGGGDGGVNRVVVGELGNGQPRRPVIMLWVDIGTQDLFNGAVRALCLPIGLRVM